MKMFEPTEIFLGEMAYNDCPRDLTYAHTFLIGDTILGCVGGRKLWNGVGEVWALFSSSIHTYPIAFTKAVKECIEFYEKELALHRMQAYVRVGYPMAQRWAEALGFECEGVMRKHGVDGTDYYMMGRVK
jgi:hypothetical protein